MNKNEYLVEGQEVSAHCGDRLVEGRIYLRSDGSRVVLQENGKWIRLQNLQRITLKGRHLYEDAVAGAMQVAKELYGTLDFNKITKDKEEPIKNEVSETLMNDKVNRVSKDDAKRIADETYTEQKASEIANNSTGGDKNKGNSIIEEFKKDPVEQKKVDQNKADDIEKTPAVSSGQMQAVKESLREHLTDALAEELGGDVTFDDVWNEEGITDIEDMIRDSNESLGDPTKDILKLEDEMTDRELDDAQDRGETFVDPEFSSISPEDREDLMKNLVERLEEEDSDLIDWMVNDYAITEDEAEKILEEGMREYLNSGKNDAISDEIDQEYENEIDSYDGDDVLEHLQDVFEVPDDVMVQIVRESRGKEYDAVLRMAEYTKKTLREGFGFGGAALHAMNSGNRLSMTGGDGYTHKDPVTVDEDEIQRAIEDLNDGENTRSELSDLISFQFKISDERAREYLDRYLGE